MVLCFTSNAIAAKWIDCFKDKGNTLILRNDECTKLCPDGYAFEKSDSNKCIPCEATIYQGIDNSQKVKNTTLLQSEITDKICVKCAPDTQFFNKKTKKCIDKDKMNKFNKQDMKRCAFCPTTTLFKQCLSCTENCATINKACFILD